MVAEGDASETTTEEYIFEPSAEEIVNELIPKSLKIQLYKAIRDSFASEHGARMTAMTFVGCIRRVYFLLWYRY